MLEIGALNPNSVLCTDQAPSPAFSALNPGSTLNPRTLNPGTIVFMMVCSSTREKSLRLVPLLDDEAPTIDDCHRGSQDHTKSATKHLETASALLKPDKISIMGRERLGSESVRVR